jgi:hypothetical protein
VLRVFHTPSVKKDASLKGSFHALFYAAKGYEDAN